jgi:hypothetical protein
MPLNSLERMAEIMKVLDSDVQKAGKLLNTEHSPYARRTFIRTLFAKLEGLTFQLKQIALERENEGFVSFSSEERSKLHEDTGFIRTPENIRFSFQSLARAYGSDFEADYGNHRWAFLRKAVAIRNSITHPKILDDLEISDSDLETLRQGMQWYHDNISEVMRQCMRKLLDAAIKSIQNPAQNK